MKCKFCNAEMDDGEKICPSCGADNSAEEIVTSSEEIPGQESFLEENAAENAPAGETSPAETDRTENGAETGETVQPEDNSGETGEEAVTPSKKKKTWKLVAGIVGGIVILAVLIGAVLYGAGIDLKPRPNDIHKKDTYVVDDQKAEKNRNTVVAAVGSKTLTNGELKIYYEMNKGNFLNYYGSYVTMMGLDPSKPLSEQVQDQDTGLTWEQFFLQSSIESWQRYAVLGMLAEEENFQPSDTSKNQIQMIQDDLKKLAENAGFESIGDMVTSDLGAGATEEGYLNYMRTYYESLDYYDTVFKRIQPTDEEIEQYYNDNEPAFTKDQIDKSAGKYVDVRHILIAPEDGTEDENGQMQYSDEAWDAAYRKAQETLEKWQSGEATEASFGDLAEQMSADGGSRQKGGLYTGVKKGQMVKPFEDWCFDESREEGNTGIVKTDFGYHIMYFVGSKEIWQAEAANRLITERTESMLKDAMERWPMEVKYGKICMALPEREKPAEPTEATGSSSGETASAAESTGEATTVPATTAEPAEN